jgi:hypothetical protein
VTFPPPTRRTIQRSADGVAVVGTPRWRDRLGPVAAPVPVLATSRDPVP